MTVLREADLSHGWSAKFNADGTLTIDHVDSTKVLTIPRESVERLQRIVHDIREEKKQ
jgi:hypothetical protein